MLNLKKILRKIIFYPHAIIVLFLILLILNSYDFRFPWFSNNLMSSLKKIFSDLNLLSGVIILFFLILLILNSYDFKLLRS